METVYTENSIRTYSGKVFDLKVMDPDTISIEDIAHALSNTARYGGHTEKFYSVAQHSVLVSELVVPKLALEGLLHDASEAYLGDMPSPFKKMMPEYQELEAKLMRVIAEKFGFNFPMSPNVKQADRYMLNTEWEALVEPTGSSYIVLCSPQEAKELFLNAFKKYTE